MTDAQILQFIQTQRPDFATYYYGTLVPNGSTPDDASMAAWARNQFAAAPGDLAQFNQWAGSVGSGGTTTDPGASIVGSNIGSPVPQASGGTPVIPNVGTPAVSPGGAQGYSQNESGGQTGSYTSVGAANQQQTGQQTQSTTGQQTNNQNVATTGQEQSNTTGTQASNTTGTSQSTGQQQTTGTSTTTSGVNAPFDLNALVNQQIGSAGQADAARQGFLTSLVSGGGNAVNSQVDQAIRRSLTGPQMTGAGDSARGRAAGYAAAEIARQDTGNRLNAAAQLAGPTGTATNVSALSPLFGRTESTNQSGNVASTNQNVMQQAQNLINQSQNNTSSSGNQATTGQQNTSGTSNTMDLQNLVSNETQAGTAAGQSASQGFGVAPAGQQVKSGGCVVCTAYVSLGHMKPGAVRRACNYKKAHWSRYGTSLTGYLLYGPLLSRAVLASSLFRTLFFPVARAVLYEEVRLSAPTRLRRKWFAYVTHGAFDFLSWPVGLFSQLVGKDTGVRCKKTLALLESQNLKFSL